ncbi:hypothetical protein MTYP_02382 [Methylophilaceae bacterium]|nr:hypothetical protein MTYP_02382 [Methylophilaceae bacterium]
MMRISACKLSILMLVSALGYAPALLAQTVEDDPDVYVQEPCTPEESRLPQETYSTEWAEVVYVSGGIGYCESQEMQRIAREYPLELMFVRKARASEQFLASIPVTIKDGKGNLVLETVTQGPILLVKLPAGKYVATGEYNGVVKTHRLAVTQKYQRVAFVWSVEN